MYKLKFPTFAAKTPITIDAEVRGEDGITKVVLFSGKAIVDETARTVRNKERQQITMSGRVYIEGDVLPGKDITGYLTFNGQERTIVSTQRTRDPFTGNVFSTELGFE